MYHGIHCVIRPLGVVVTVFAITTAAVIMIEAVVGDFTHAEFNVVVIVPKRQPTLRTHVWKEPWDEEEDL